MGEVREMEKDATSGRSVMGGVTRRRRGIRLSDEDGKQEGPHPQRTSTTNDHKGTA